MSQGRKRKVEDEPEPVASRMRDTSQTRAGPQIQSTNSDLLLIDGCLTPRMFQRLAICAEVSVDVFENDTDGCFVRGIPKPGRELSICLFDYVPTIYRDQVYKSFALGFHGCLAAIAATLCRRKLPVVDIVMMEWATGIYDQRYRSYYLDHGGRIEYALDAILSRSKEEHEIFGDGSFVDVPTFKAAIDALPSHPKDNDYEFIRERLLGVDFRGGPFYFSDEEDDDDDEDAEDGNGFVFSFPVGLNNEAPPGSVPWPQVPGNTFPRADSQVPHSSSQMSGWQTWPRVAHCDWGHVYISSLGRTGYYDDDGDCDEDDEDSGDPMCIVYLGTPLLGDCVEVPLSDLRKPPFDGSFSCT